MTLAITKTRPSKYPEHVKDKAFTVLALCGGSGTRAHEQLDAAGIFIPIRTLDYWRNNEPERYTRIATQIAPQVAERIATEAEEIAICAADVERQALQRLGKEIDTIPAKELSTTLRNLSTSKALQIDKVASPLRGRPSVITENRDPAQLLEAIKRRFPSGIVDGVAEEITEVETV